MYTKYRVYRPVSRPVWKPEIREITKRASQKMDDVTKLSVNISMKMTNN